jgi:hypothetical protein
MADSVMLTNTQALIALGTELAEKGEMTSNDIESFYERNQRKLDFKSFAKVMTSPDLFQSEKEKWIDPQKDEDRPLSASLSNLIPRPTKVADINELIRSKKAAEVAKVALPEELPIAKASVNQSVQCASAMSQLHNVKF